MLLRIVDVVFPVFALVLCGWWVGHRQRPDLQVANRLNMEVFLPALVFAALSDANFNVRAHLAPALAMAVMVFGSGLAGWPIARLLGVAPRTLVPPLMFNNCGNLGLPFALLAFGPAMVPTAVMMFLTSNMLHFSLGATLLDHRQRFTPMWRTPVVLATVGGLVLSLGSWRLWPPLHLASHMLGEICVPLMLFALGVKVAEAPLHHIRLGLVAGALRPLLGIAIMLGMILLLQIKGPTAGLCLLYGALPPAVLNYLFADRHDQEPAHVASIVVIGNLLTVLVVPLVLVVILAVPQFH